MLHSKDPSELSEFAKQYGVAPVRRMYQWANNNVRYTVSSDIQWLRRDEVRNRVLIQAREAALLCEIIEATSDTQVEELVVVGELVGADTVTQKFHIRVPSGEDIEGSFEESFVRSGEIVLNRSYTATIRKSTTIQYATEK